MLSRAAESIGLHYRPPPSPERSRLDDWFLGAQAERRQPPPVPFFPEVHEEVTRSWKAPVSARNRPSASSVLTTLDGGAAQGYVEVPPVERAIAMQLCPQGAAAWRGNPRLPSRACKFSFALTAKAYGAAGQAASALHAMALLQVHQAKALKQLHEGDADPGVLQELRTATDLALRATKVTARALGQTMSTLVSRSATCGWPWRIWGSPTSTASWNSPISQAGLFGEAVEDFAQQFSAAQKQTEAFRHILPRRSAAVSTPPSAAAPPSARRQGTLLLPPPPPQLGHNSSLQYGRSMELAAGDRWSPPLPLPSPWSARAGGVPETGDPEPLDPALQEMVTAPLLPPEEGRVENLLFPFCSVPPLTPGFLVPKTSIKEQFPFPFPRGRGWQCTRPRLHTPVPLSLRQWAAGSGPRTRRLLPHPLPNYGARSVSHHTLRPHFETHCLSSRAPVLHFAAPPWVRQ